VWLKGFRSAMTRDGTAHRLASLLIVRFWDRTDGWVDASLSPYTRRERTAVFRPGCDEKNEFARMEETNQQGLSLRYFRTVD